MCNSKVQGGDTGGIRDWNRSIGLVEGYILGFVCWCHKYSHGRDKKWKNKKKIRTKSVCRTGSGWDAAKWRLVRPFGAEFLEQVRHKDGGTMQHTDEFTSAPRLRHSFTFEAFPCWMAIVSCIMSFRMSQLCRVARTFVGKENNGYNFSKITKRNNKLDLHWHFAFAALAVGIRRNQDTSWALTERQGGLPVLMPFWNQFQVWMTSFAFYRKSSFKRHCS